MSHFYDYFDILIVIHNSNLFYFRQKTIVSPETYRFLEKSAHHKKVLKFRK